MLTFRDLNLNTPLLNALDEMEVIHPTSIQSKVFSVIMSGKDVLGIAQTGTGKTFAYLLPCMRMWKFAKNRNPQILIVVPTRELVVQVTEEAKKLARFMNFEAAGVYGGANINTQAAMLANGVDLLVATPGRLFDLILKGSINTKYIRQFIIDEVDEMLSLGFRHQLVNLFEILPLNRQNLMFSATLTEDVESILETFFANPERIEAAPAGTPIENIRQVLYLTPNFNTRINLLKLLLQQNESMNKVLVFVASRKLADDVYEQIEPVFGAKVGLIHSNKSQNQRFRAVESFKNGETRLLVSTDIIARGIDIAEVSHVINFDLPDDPETYIHRIGRTGRYDQDGDAISFVITAQKKALQGISKFMQKRIHELVLPEDLEISEELTEDEKPVVRMKEIALINAPDAPSGPSFHEKSEKNKKTNYTVRRKDKLKAKYKKPKTRGQRPAKRPK
jgi:ATP-dependent RNA helicase RhlE